MSDVKLFPAWKQALRDFLVEFKAGEIVSHDWLAARFGLPVADEKMSAATYQARQFEWLANVEAFKSELLHEHRIALQSVRGEGYRWLPPHEQTAFATKEFERDAGKVFRIVGNRLKHLRVDELTDEQRRENIDAIAKMSQLRGTVRKQLR